jgi:hypothetical protein
MVSSDPVSIDNSDGRLELFARGADNALWHNWQTKPHAGPRSAWASLGGYLMDDSASGCATSAAYSARLAGFLTM